ncbi:MAG: T9SS type A sorting domain-containing protein [Saprospiraceae bacterium]
MPQSEYQALFDSLGPMPAGLGPMTFDLPIWFNFVTGVTEEGETNWKNEFAPLQMLSEINGYFSSTGIQFYLCGTTQIANDQLVNLDLGSEGSTLRNLAAQQNPDYDNVINVFLVGKLVVNGESVGGWFGIPNSGSPGAAYCRQGGALGANTIAHELGHYLSIPHTYLRGPIPNDPLLHPERAQYVNDEVDLMVNGVLTTFICEGPNGTGDGFCDTPADPTFINIDSRCGFEDDCITFESCDYPTDPLGVPYNPDPSLIMGDYHTCSYRFSADQALQMKMMLTSNNMWGFLIDTIEPICQNLSSSDRGFIQRNCLMILPINPIGPMSEIPVPFQDANQNSCGSPEAITDNNGRYLTFACVYPYNGSGMLSVLPDVDHPYPLNGVTTYDLGLISKHILAIEPFENPFQIIAADANNSGSVTTFDIVELRKLILGIHQELPNNNRWRFVPEYCFKDSIFSDEFYDTSDSLGINPFDAKWVNLDEPVPVPPDSTNERTYGSGALQSAPNSSSWMDHVTLDPNSIGAQNPDAWSLWGIKVGDVNCSAIIDLLSTEDPDHSFTTISHTSINSNQLIILEVKASSDSLISAWQFGVDFAEDTLQIIEIQPGNSSETFSEDNFGLTALEEGKFRALNFTENGTGTNLNGKTLFKIKMRSLNPISNIGQRFRLKNSVLSKKFYSSTGEEIENVGLQLEISSAQTFTGSNGGKPASIASEAYYLSAFPVPFSSEIIFDFFLPNDEPVHLSLFDSFGRLVVEQKESLSKGPQSLKISTLAAQPAGLYWYSFESGTQVLFGKIIKN